MSQRIIRAASCCLAIVSATTPVNASAQRVDTIVKNAGAPRYTEIATLVEEMNIGVVDGADEYVFGEIADVAVSKDGTVYVLDRKVFGVRVYDAKGKYVRTIGRRGQGPGEVASASGIGILPDGRLLLWDTGNWRVNVYSATGQSIAHWSFATSGGGSSTSTVARGMVIDTAGFVYIRRDVLVRPADGSRPHLDPKWLKLRSTDGAVLDTIAQPEWPVKPGMVEGKNGGSFVSAPIPFSPEPAWLVSPLGYLITGVPSRYAFELHTSPGSVLSVRRDVKAEAVSNAQRDSARKDVEEKIRKSIPDWSWGSTDIPTIRPSYEGITTGLDGRIWISRVKEVAPRVGSTNMGMGIGRGSNMPRNPTADAPPIPKRPALYDVFEPNGAFIAQVRVPPRVATAVRRGDYVWGIAYDDDDVATVKRYRIVWK